VTDADLDNDTYEAAEKQYFAEQYQTSDHEFEQLCEEFSRTESTR